MIALQKTDKSGQTSMQNTTLIHSDQAGNKPTVGKNRVGKTCTRVWHDSVSIERLTHIGQRDYFTSILYGQIYENVTKDAARIRIFLIERTFTFHLFGDRFEEGGHCGSIFDATGYLF
jgi:hypothetical protein